MGKFSEVDLTIREIWRSIFIITIILIVMNIANIMRNIQTSKIEQRPSQQEEYMHQVQADVDNLYRRVE